MICEDIFYSRGAVEPCSPKCADDATFDLDAFDSEEAPCSFFAVYDGHVGVAAAKYAARNIHRYAVNNLKFSSSNWPEGPRAALHEAFLRVDEELKGISPPQSDGSCALVVLVKHSPDGKASNILSGTLGDSRAVLCRGGKAHSLSPKHSFAAR